MIREYKNFVNELKAAEPIVALGSIVKDSDNSYKVMGLTDEIVILRPIKDDGKIESGDKSLTWPKDFGGKKFKDFWKKFKKDNEN